MSLAQQVRAFSLKAMERSARVVRETVEEAGERLIARSPQDTGQFRANWFAGLDRPQTLTVDRTGPHTLQGLEAIADPLGHMIYISNSLPYALRLEFGFVGPDSIGRVYNQAGLGFAGAVGVELRTIAESIARRVAST